MEFLKNPNFDFLSKTRYFVGASLLIILAGLVYMHQYGIRYGVEFSGGTQLILQFDNPPDIGRVRGVVDQIIPGAATIQGYDAPAKHEVLVRVAGTDVASYGPGILQSLQQSYAENPAQAVGSDETQMTLQFQSPPALDSVRAAVAKAAPLAVVETSQDPTKNQLTVRADPSRGVLTALTERYAENRAKVVGSETVGPVVGGELRRKAVQLTALGLLFQLIYIGIRFKGAIWGTAATVASLHDVLITLAFLAFFHYEITLNVIAALLTLVGYSVNDTIVIFDRARENLRQRRKEGLAPLLNTSVNQTLTRTLISNGTTFLAVLGLYLFGGEALAGFSFAMVVGIVVGTYSTIYIASPIVIWWDAFTRRRAAGSAQA
jgi:preprotein translocase subunit SecF